MKKLIFALLCCLAFATHDASAQTYRFKTTGFTVLDKIRGGGKWSDFQTSSMVITLDSKKDRIVVYSQEVQLYRIVSYEPKEETDDDLIYPFICQDDDGQKFTITIITRKKQGNRKQLYINQKDFVIAYNIENLD